MGSVKTLEVIEEPTEDKRGSGIFTFRDDFSVFDYGTMPNKILGKGVALAKMAAYNFKELKKIGIVTHYKGMKSPNQMEVELVRVLDPQKEEIKENSVNLLIPLEVIFRNTITHTSSAYRRMNSGKLEPYLLGLDDIPSEDELPLDLKNPFVECSTKLEEKDRYISWEEAQEVSTLNEREIKEVIKETLKINDYITEKAESIGIKHLDGKVEFAYTDRAELMLVDVCGTPDENTFLFNGINTSKQVLRDWYATTPWKAELEKAQKEGLPKHQWPEPPSIPQKLISIASYMYGTISAEWTSPEEYSAMPTLEAITERYKNFLKEKV